MSETALIVERTPYIIATEINSIKSQTRTIMLQASIEIGRRLIEAKALVPHGEWENWLEGSVDYSPRTARNLMRIYEEYGNDQTSFFDEANRQALADLTYTQAVALLGIPAEERAEFAEEHDLESMSTRELQQAIRERDEARKQRDAAREAAQKLDSGRTLLSEQLEESRRIAKDLEEKLKGISPEKYEGLQQQLAAAQDRVRELEEEASQPVTLEPAVIERVPVEVERELAELRAKVKAGDKHSGALLKFKITFDVLVKDFNDLLAALGEIKTAAPDEYEKYDNAVLQLLEKMVARL